MFAELVAKARANRVAALGILQQRRPALIFASCRSACRTRAFAVE
ncbi:hypothetical protein [Frigidibacter sp. ROC022]|nr:hypothetical protein [Frigidibacter sp. ROC022]MCR8723396.1 hypothetical protein [Frigidibacter sp. ROC022]